MKRNSYTNPEQVRAYLGLSSDIAPDSVLSEFISKADIIVRDILTIKVKDEEITPIQKQFKVKHYPIADINFDKKIDPVDVKVYGWTKQDDPTTKQELTVSKVIFDYGIIELTEEPTGFEKMTVDYSYSEDILDWDKVSLASIYLTGYLFACREFLFLPTRMAIGPFRIMFPPERARIRTFKDLPYQRLYDEFIRIISRLKKKPVQVVTPEIMTRLEVETVNPSA